MIKRVVGLCLSPMEESIEIIEGIAEEIASKLNEERCCNVESEFYGFGDIITSGGLSFDSEDVVVLGVPVVRGHVPAPCYKLLSMIESKGSMTSIVATYGGGSYGRSLSELYAHAEELGFKVISAAAFVAKHQRRTRVQCLGERRPDARDFEMVATFGKISGRKIRRLGGCEVDLMQVKPAPLCVRSTGPVMGFAFFGIVKRKEPEWFL